MTISIKLIEAIFFIPLIKSDFVRVGWTIESILKFCPKGTVRIVVILDGLYQSEFPDNLRHSEVQIVESHPASNKHWGKIWKMQCNAMTAQLNDPAVSRNAIFVKIDSDSILLRPGFIERAQVIFASRPKAGQLGQGYSNVLGGRLPNNGWANLYRKLNGFHGVAKFQVLARQAEQNIMRGIFAHGRFRALMRVAVSNGYVHGDLAIGGCYVLRREVVEKIASMDMLSNSPFDLLPNVGEDVIMTPHVYATGYSMVEDVCDGGLFAIEGKNFRVDPFVLKQRGHYVLHPLKYGWTDGALTYTEAQLIEKLIGTSAEFP